MAKKKRDHICQECGKGFAQIQTLRNHIGAVHDKIKKHKCDECEKSFSQKMHFKKHILTVREKIKDYTCDYCGREFSHKTRLQEHVKALHMKVKDYQCDLCDYKSSQITKLNLHVEAKHKCNVCSHQFLSKQALKNHKKCVHGNKKELQCMISNKIFNLAIQLRQHVKIAHHQMKTTSCSCPICYREFSGIRDLKFHVKIIHSHNKDEICKECGLGFCDPRDVKRHMMAEHNDKSLKENKLQPRLLKSDQKA